MYSIIIPLALSTAIYTGSGTSDGDGYSKSFSPVKHQKYFRPYSSGHTHLIAPNRDRGFFYGGGGGGGGGV